MKLTNDTFDFIRFLAETGITALGILYKGLAEVWSLPYGEAVMTTTLLVSTFLGVFTEYQRKKHKKQSEFFEGMEDKEE